MNVTMFCLLIGNIYFANDKPARGLAFCIFAAFLILTGHGL